MKSGIVAIIGRTNAGKSTLLNNILKQKVAITSPKPGTTIMPIEAVLDEERGQILFIDTPGISANTMSEPIDIVLYVVDHTRQRGSEENKMIGILRQFKNTPKILVFNKMDIKTPDYSAQYLFIKNEVQEMVEVSALEEKHIGKLLELLFSYLPERKPIIESKYLVTPLVNMDAKQFISEIIREKILLFTGQEVPYQTAVEILDIQERKNGSKYIQAKIKTTNDRYKKILIGDQGRKIKQIGTVARKELELATNKKVFLDLLVETVG